MVSNVKKKSNHVYLMNFTTPHHKYHEKQKPKRFKLILYNSFHYFLNSPTKDNQQIFVNFPCHHSISVFTTSTKSGF